MEAPPLAAVIAGLLAIIVPPLVSLLKSANAPPWAPVLIAVIVSLAAAILSLVIDGTIGRDTPLTLETVLGYMFAVFSLSTVVYRLYFKQTPANAALTAFGSRAPAPDQRE